MRKAIHGKQELVFGCVDLSLCSYPEYVLWYPDLMKWYSILSKQITIEVPTVGIQNRKLCFQSLISVIAVYLKHLYSTANILYCLMVSWYWNVKTSHQKANISALQSQTSNRGFHWSLRKVSTFVEVLVPSSEYFTLGCKHLNLHNQMFHSLIRKVSTFCGGILVWLSEHFTLGNKKSH